MKPSFLFILSTLLLSPLTALSKIKKIELDKKERKEIIKRAKVWDPKEASKITQKNLLQGPRPQSGKWFDFNETVRCRFEEFDLTDIPGGKTPKFFCRMENGKKIKVKYGYYNGEVYSEVAATRLFWALGFPADRMYPVKIICENCPKHPWQIVSLFQKNGEINHQRFARKTRSFFPAVIEYKFGGVKIEKKKPNGTAKRDRRGWDIPEMFKYKHQEKEEMVRRDALALLVGLIHYSDNKADNQRIVCPNNQLVNQNGKVDCRKPILMIQDLGGSFAKGFEVFFKKPWWKTSKMEYSKWKNISLFRSKWSCRIKLKKNPSGTFRGKKISEKARIFLLRLLKKLSDKQILDLFKASRIELRKERIKENGKSRLVTARDWMKTFKSKVWEIEQKKCN